MDRAVVTIPGFQEIKQIVRILHPLSAWIGAEPAHAKPQCFGDSRDSKNDSILVARREIQRRRRHAPSCMGATDGQRNWPETRKTLGKPGFLSGEERIRSPRENTGKTGPSEQSGADSGADSGALDAREVPLDSDLAAMVDAWPALPAAIKAGILARIRATGGHC